MSMFRSLQGLKCVATIFHDAKVSASKAFVQQVKTQFPDPNSLPFLLEITESKPTRQQIDSIEAFDSKLAATITKQGVKYPLTVDWFNAKASMGDAKGGLTILEELAKNAKS